MIGFLPVGKVRKRMLLQTPLFSTDLRIKICIKYKNLTIQSLKPAFYALNWILQEQLLLYGKNPVIVK
jgi:hypothetical protein